MDLSRVAAALADPVRIAILKLISDPPGQPACSEPEGDVCCSAGVCVCEFAEHLRISQPRASYHLRILKEAGLITEQPRGKWTFYKIAPERITDFCAGLKRISGLGE